MVNANYRGIVRFTREAKNELRGLNGLNDKYRVIDNNGPHLVQLSGGSIELTHVYWLEPLSFQDYLTQVEQL